MSTTRRLAAIITSGVWSLTVGKRTSRGQAISVAIDPEPTLGFASHNTKKRHSRPARGAMAERLSRPCTSLI
jgi:hypothetical protein